LENLPYKLTSFGKSTMKIRSFLKIYHANKIFLENLPFNSMAIDIKGTVAQDF
jgi:hypothetical protein